MELMVRADFLKRHAAGPWQPPGGPVCLFAVGVSRAAQKASGRADGLSVAGMRHALATPKIDGSVTEIAWASFLGWTSAGANEFAAQLQLINMEQKKKQFPGNWSAVIARIADPDAPHAQNLLDFEWQSKKMIEGADAGAVLEFDLSLKTLERIG